MLPSPDEGLATWCLVVVPFPESGWLVGWLVAPLTFRSSVVFYHKRRAIMLGGGSEWKSRSKRKVCQSHARVRDHDYHEVGREVWQV